MPWCWSRGRALLQTRFALRSTAALSAVSFMAGGATLEVWIQT